MLAATKATAAEEPAYESGDFDFELKLIRLHRYLSREDLAWLASQDEAAARRRWRWCFGQYLFFCRDLQHEQRRLSKERSMSQCAPVGELLRTEAAVYAGIAELLWLGALHFGGVRYDSGRIVQQFLGVHTLMHPSRLAVAGVPG